jgi:hypothetical protein
MNVPGFVSLAEAVSMIVVERTAQVAVAERTAQVASGALKSRIKVLGGPYSAKSRWQRGEAWLELRTSLFAGHIKSYLANWHEILAQVPEDTWHEYYPFPSEGKGSWLRILTEQGAVAGSVVVRIADVHKLTHEEFSYSSLSIRLRNSLAADGENHDDPSHVHSSLERTHFQRAAQPPFLLPASFGA